MQINPENPSIESPFKTKPDQQDNPLAKQMHDIASHTFADEEYVSLPPTSLPIKASSTAKTTISSPLPLNSYPLYQQQEILRKLDQDTMVSLVASLEEGISIPSLENFIASQNEDGTFHLSIDKKNTTHLPSNNTSVTLSDDLSFLPIQSPLFGENMKDFILDDFILNKASIQTTFTLASIPENHNLIANQPRDALKERIERRQEYLKNYRELKNNWSISKQEITDYLKNSTTPLSTSQRAWYLERLKYEDTQRLGKEIISITQPSYFNLAKAMYKAVADAYEYNLMRYQDDGMKAGLLIGNPHDDPLEELIKDPRAANLKQTLEDNSWF